MIIIFINSYYIYKYNKYNYLFAAIILPLAPVSHFPMADIISSCDEFLNLDFSMASVT